MQRPRPVLFLALAAAVAAAACDGVSKSEHETALARAAEVEAQRKDVESQLRSAQESLAASEAKAREAAEKLAAVEARALAAEGTAAERAKQLEEAKTAREKLEKRRDAIASHRDELKEWVEKTLLPIAEKHDPRLASLKSVAGEMAKEVARIRGLPWKQDVMQRLVTRTDVGEWMRRDLKKELPPEKAKEIVLVGAEMGLNAPDIDLHETFSGFLEAAAAAFYKPDTRTFYHIEGNEGRGAYPVVFHELVHAVEDQHFDLDAMYKAVEDDADRAFALRGLIEGSASLYQTLYEKENPEDAKAMLASQLDPALLQKQMKMLDEVPPSVTAAYMLYPYQNGKIWCRRLGAQDPAVAEKLFRDPPVSTEQVLHPEKFALDGPRDWPHLVSKPELGDVLGTGWKSLAADSMGELMCGVLLTQLRNAGDYQLTTRDLASGGGKFTLKDPAKRAVEGWDGDRYAAWVQEGTERVVIVWTTVWDSEADAAEFVQCYAPLLGKKVTGTRTADPPSPIRYAEALTGRVSGLEVRGRRAVAVLGAPADKVETLFERGFAASVEPDARDATDVPAAAVQTK